MMQEIVATIASQSSRAQPPKAGTETPAGLRLNLGCGPIRIPGFIGVDQADSDAVDVRMDVSSYLGTLDAGSVSEIYSRHFLEHVASDQLHALLREMDRVLAPGGSIRIIVPHFSNPYFYSDPTHRQAFGVHTFSYLCQESCLHRGVPSYAALPGWKLVGVRVRFEPYRRLRVAGLPVPALSDVLNKLLNGSWLAIELFERYLSGILSIYEVEFRVRKERG